MRMTIVVSNVRGGGSTFAAVNWANAWAARGEQITIIAIHPQDGEGRDFPRHPAIHLLREDLGDKPVPGKWQAAGQIWHNLRRMRQLVRQSKPELVLSFDGPVNTRTLVACLGLRIPVVVMEQVHPAHYSFGLFWERCRRMVYPRAAALVNLTQAATEWCAKSFAVKRLATIPNPVLPPAARKLPSKKNTKRVVAAGRLVDQKRFDLLIEAFALIAAAHPDWRLTIYGEGPSRPALERQVEKNGLAGRITLAGWVENLSERMAEGEFFVLSSEYEGFGNVIVEAMAVGLPVVSFDCPSGPGDIIRHEVDGLLAPPLNIAALAAAMERLMDDDSLRARLSSRATEVLERFSLARTLKLWDAVIDETLISSDRNTRRGPGKQPFGAVKPKPGVR